MDEPLECELVDVVFTQVLIERPPVVYVQPSEKVREGDPVVLFELSSLDDVDDEPRYERTGRKVHCSVVSVAKETEAGVAITLGNLSVGNR